MKDSYHNKCFAVDPSFVSRRIADEYILVPIRQKAGDIESIYTLNEVAARIWELIDGKNRLEEIRDRIVQEFEVSREVAETDITELLKQLEQIGALKAV